MGDLQLSVGRCEISQSGTLSSLHRAAEVGDVEKIKEIFASLTEKERDCQLSSAAGSSGELPLHCAAAGGQLDALMLLMPENCPDLIDARTRKEGLSALHLAAVHGYSTIAHWLIESRSVDMNLQDHVGCTPLHLSVWFGHKEVVRYLVSKGAKLFVLDNDHMFPASYCKDQSMFDALFSNFMSHSGSFNKARTVPLVDAEKRSILHYAAQYGTNPSVIARLITETDSDLVYAEDKNGDSFFHVAAKSGNMNVFEALDKAYIHIDMARLLNNSSGHDPLKSPGMYALLNDHRDFFDELAARGNVKITLSCIIKALVAELIDKPEIQRRLAMFGSTLPTYLALYANKYFVFDFLLERLLSLSQWDDKYYRTCMHWAILDQRTDIVQKLCNNIKLWQQWPGIQDRDGKTAQQHAFEQKNHMVIEMLNAKRTFKEHEEKLNRDREVYVQALNAILVGAALIASVTFAGWLQVPSGSEFKSLAMKIYWASNSVSFFTAVATMCVTKTALLPTPSRYVGVIVNQLRLAIVLDAFLLALSLAAVMWAFAAAGFAALRHADIWTYQVIMRTTTAVGGGVCFIMWVAFVLQLFKCTPPKSVLFALLPLFPFGFLGFRWCPTWLENLRAGVGDSSRMGYPSMERSELQGFMDKDLVPYRAGQVNPISRAETASSFPSLETVKKLLHKLDIPGKDEFISDICKQRNEEGTTKKRGISHIPGRCSMPNSPAAQ